MIEIKKTIFTSKIRIYPTKKQKETLDFWFRKTNILYNVALEEKIYYYQYTGKYLNPYDQKKELVGIKMDDPTWSEIPNKALQDIIFRLDKSFKSFFNGGGFPKFKLENKTLTFVKTDVRLIKGKLFLPKIKESFKYKEDINPNWTSIKIKKDIDKYFIIFTYKKETKLELNINDDVIGVDLGLKDLYTDSNNYSSGRFSKKLIKKYHKRISDLGRSLSNKKRGSIRYQKTKKHLSKTHKRLYNTLDDYLDKKSNILLNNKQTYISLGNINIESIIKKNSGNYTKKGLIKSFYSNGLGKFKQMVIDKSTRLKKIIILVDEKDTTKTCSCCGHKKVMELKERNYNCLNCGNSIGRDYNSSINMKLLGSSILSGCPDDFVLKYIEEHNISQNNKK